MMKNLMPIIICAILLCGCSAFSVHNSLDKDVKGVPFYIKTGHVKQTTSYTRGWIEATLDYHEIQNNQDVTASKRSATFLIDKATYDQKAIIGALISADKAAEIAPDGTTRFGNAVTIFTQNINASLITQKELAEQSNPVTDTAKAVKLSETLESNTSEIESVVDYSHIYYFNSTVPPFGTTTANLELNPDGTLSKAISTVDSQKLSEHIPLKELLLDKLGLAVAAKEEAKGAKPAQKNYSLTLSITTNGYKYILVKNHIGNTGTSLDFAPLAFHDRDISISRVSFDTPPKASDTTSEGKQKKNAITIEGTVTLPDSK